jgi:DNA replication licensing factor MCM2
MPRSKDVMLLNDLVDAVRPGEAVVVTGVYEHSFEPRENARAGFPVYSTVVTANHVARRGEAYSEARLTDEDRAEIRALARDPRVGERIAKVRALLVGVWRVLRSARGHLCIYWPSSAL